MRAGGSEAQDLRMKVFCMQHHIGVSFTDIAIMRG
jgi:hypothetical protein